MSCRNAYISNKCQRSQEKRVLQVKSLLSCTEPSRFTYDKRSLHSGNTSNQWNSINHNRISILSQNRSVLGNWLQWAIWTHGLAGGVG